jgi:hypothetical protein
LAREAAGAGYRVLVAANNPINRFLIEMHAVPPEEPAMVAILAALTASRKGDERLEPHLLSLYETTCPGCRKEVSAEAFIWDREARAPARRVINCPHCGENGDFPALESDAVTASRFSTTGLHHARALERVASIRDPDREHVEAALQNYTPRAVYALFTLINKLDGLQLDPRQRDLFAALLLVALDRANNLWGYPSGRSRPKLLVTPGQHIERNVWRALEDAVVSWKTLGSSSLPLTYWPDQPPEQGGVCLFEGRMRALAKSMEEVDLKGVATAIPRPNQAFWTLSALWAGWLWGRKAMGPFKSVLRRRRYDWHWHTTAIEAALSHLVPKIDPEIPVFTLVPEAEPGLMTAFMTAADLAGLQVDGFALRSQDRLAQITWSARPREIPADPPDSVAIASEAGNLFLSKIGEPVPFLPLQAGLLAQLANRQALTLPGHEPADAYTRTAGLFHQALTYRAGFLRYGGSEHALDVGRWWLRDDQEASEPLADRVEAEVARLLAAQPGLTLAAIDQTVCEAFPGLQTPGFELVYSCLASYGVETEPGGWVFRPQDEPAVRDRDQVEMAGHLVRLGQKLGFETAGEAPITWSEPGEPPSYRFFITSTAALGKILFHNRPIPGQAWIVLPGSRSNLVMYKRGRDPRLEQVIGDRWGFLKYRLLRRLAENTQINRENLSEQLALDPLMYESSQMRML